MASAPVPVAPGAGLAESADMLPHSPAASVPAPVAGRGSGQSPQPPSQQSPAPASGLQIGLMIRALPASLAPGKIAEPATPAVQGDAIAAKPEVRAAVAPIQAAPGPIAPLPAAPLLPEPVRQRELAVDIPAVAQSLRAFALPPRPPRAGMAGPSDTAAPAPGAPVLPIAAPPVPAVTPVIIAPAPPPGVIAPEAPQASEMALQPQDFDTLVQRLTEAREAARPGQADLLLNHREFGKVVMQFELVEQQLKVALASRDAGFAQAAQAAIAERGLPMVSVVSEAARAEPMAARSDAGAPSSGQQSAIGGNGAGPGHPSSARDERGSPSEQGRRHPNAPAPRHSAEQSGAHPRDSGLYA